MIKCSINFGFSFWSADHLLFNIFFRFINLEGKKFFIWPIVFFSVLRLRQFWEFCTLLYVFNCCLLLWLKVNMVKLRYVIIFSQINSLTFIIFSSIFISHLSFESCESAVFLLQVQLTKNFLFIIFSVKVAGRLLQVSLSCTVELQPESGPSAERRRLTASAASSRDAAVGVFQAQWFLM